MPRKVIQRSSQQPIHHSSKKNLSKSTRKSTRLNRQTLRSPIIKPKKTPNRISKRISLKAPQAPRSKFSPYRSKKIITIGLFTVAILLVVIIFSWLLKFFFSVEQITCTVNQGSSCPQILVKHLGTLRSRNLFFTDFDELLTQLHNPSLDFIQATYQKRLPHTLDLDFTFPPAAYEIQSSNHSFYLTTTGSLAYAGNLGLLLVTDRSGTLENDLLNAQLDNFLHQKIIELNTWKNLTSGSITNFDYYNLETAVIPLGNRQYVIDLLHLDEGLQTIDFLEQNWREEDQTSADYIDLRFKLPVLRYSSDFLTASPSGAYNDE